MITNNMLICLKKFFLCHSDGNFKEEELVNSQKITIIKFLTEE